MLHRHRLIERARFGYHMTTAGIDFVKRFYFEINSGTRVVPGPPGSENNRLGEKGGESLFGTH